MQYAIRPTLKNTAPKSTEKRPKQTTKTSNRIPCLFVLFRFRRKKSRGKGGGEGGGGLSIDKQNLHRKVQLPKYTFQSYTYVRTREFRGRGLLGCVAIRCVYGDLPFVARCYRSAPHNFICVKPPRAPRRPRRQNVSHNSTPRGQH